MCSNQLSYRPLVLRVSCKQGRRTGRGQNVVSAVRLFRFTMSISIYSPWRNTLKTENTIMHQNLNHKTPSTCTLRCTCTTMQSLWILLYNQLMTSFPQKLYLLSVLCNSIIISFICPMSLAKRMCTGISLKGGDPAAPSGTATLLRLSPSHRFRLRRYRYRLRAPPAPMA